MKDVFTTGDISKICEVAPRTVAKWCDNGFLSSYRIPGGVDRRITLDSLEKFLDKNSYTSGIYILNFLKAGGKLP